MSDAYVIELQGNAVGIIVRQERDELVYRFLSAHYGFNSLEGAEFASPFQAERAARKLWREQPHILAYNGERQMRAAFGR